MSLRDIQIEVTNNAIKKGFYNHETYDPKEMLIGLNILLIGTEVSEASDCHRKGDYEHLPSELADIIIRTLSIFGQLGIDAEDAVIEKIKQNKSRPPKHGNIY